MPLLTDPDQLTQGTPNAVVDLRFSAAAGANISLDSAGTNLPVVADDDYFEVRTAIDTNNNGLYRVVDAAPSTTQIDAIKLTGANPTNSGVDNAAAVLLGDTTLKKNVHFDTAANEIFLIEQTGLLAAGVELNTVYSFGKEEWKDDDFLRQFPFPFFAIDLDAGKYQVGTDGSNPNGWNFAADNSVDGLIRTKKLIRAGGWSELDSAGNQLRVYAGIITLGTFEDEVNDNAYFQFGTDTTVADEVDFTFAGPVDEAIECFNRLADGAIFGGTGIAISLDGRTLTRSDGGNWSTDGFKVGGEIVFRDSEDVTMDGTWLLKVVGAGVDGVVTCGRAADANSGLAITGTDTITRADGGSWLTDGWIIGSKLILTASEDVGNDGTHILTSVSDTAIAMTASTLTNNADDTLMVCGMFDDALTPDIVINAAVDNRKAFAVKLRVRDGDPNGKTFDFSNLALAGVTTLNNFIFRFPLANETDLKITVADTGIDADSNGTPDVAPYTGMTITYFATAQAKSGLVGGSFNFGVVINANSGTAIQVYEFVQWSLRSTGGFGSGDIDNDADTAIGRTMGDLLVFEGDVLVAGDQQSINPDGGGVGVFIENIAAADQNNLRLVDNTGTRRQFPETISVTLDFNAALIDDAAAEYVLFFDRTIRNSVADLVITAGTGPVGTFNSAGANLPAAMDNDPDGYVRVSGFTGGDAAMNGTYQVQSTDTTSLWNVTRYDGVTIVTTAAGAAEVDEHPVDSPDAIIVDSDVPAPVTGTASADFNFAFDYDGNVQGGRSISTPTSVIARAIGLSGAQFIQSSVATITSGTPLTIVLTASGELNYINV